MFHMRFTIRTMDRHISVVASSFTYIIIVERGLYDERF